MTKNYKIKWIVIDFMHPRFRRVVLKLSLSEREFSGDFLVCNLQSIVSRCLLGVFSCLLFDVFLWNTHFDVIKFMSIDPISRNGGLSVSELPDWLIDQTTGTSNWSICSFHSSHFPINSPNGSFSNIPLLFPSKFSLKAPAHKEFISIFIKLRISENNIYERPKY